MKRVPFLHKTSDSFSCIMGEYWTRSQEILDQVLTQPFLLCDIKQEWCCFLSSSSLKWKTGTRVFLISLPTLKWYNVSNYVGRRNVFIWQNQQSEIPNSGTGTTKIFTLWSIVFSTIWNWKEHLHIYNMLMHPAMDFFHFHFSTLGIFLNIRYLFHSFYNFISKS